ncbi:MAG: DegT/DnrJ/EryC1/StrS aminotransferase family protein [bacterium]|nr:DegT/DnrJ/EryC1/StrS aminotransferase family protein [bacterium]
MIAEDEIAAVDAVLRSGKLNSWTGDENRLFEEEYAKAVGSRHAIALANGTLALELALHAIGLKEGDEVIVPARSFFATASSVVRMGGRPVFADVELDNQNLSADTVRAVLTDRARAVICVHLAGHPCDLNPLLELCREKGLRLIEDCAQAHGALYRGRPVGSFGDIGCFSFCQDKIITTGGEGGMLVTNRERLWRRSWDYKDHGKSHDAIFGREHPPGFRWLHESFGSNFRLTEIQAAIGRCQLGKLEGWVAARRRHARALQDALADHPLVRAPFEAGYARHAFYKFYLFVRPEKLAAGWDRERLIEEANAAGVPCLSGSCPEIYREKAFAGGPLAPEHRLPGARELGETSLMLQVHHTLSDETIRERATVLRALFDRAAGLA